MSRRSGDRNRPPHPRSAATDLLFLLSGTMSSVREGVTFREMVRRAGLHAGTVNGELSALWALQATFGETCQHPGDVEAGSAAPPRSLSEYAQEDKDLALARAFGKVETAWYFCKKLEESAKFLARVEKISLEFVECYNPLYGEPREDGGRVVVRRLGRPAPMLRIVANAYVEDGCKMDLRSRLSQLPLEMAKATPKP